MGIYFAVGIDFGGCCDSAPIEIELAPLLSWLEGPFEPTEYEPVKPLQYVEETSYGSSP